MNPPPAPIQHKSLVTAPKCCKRAVKHMGVCWLSSARPMPGAGLCQPGAGGHRGWEKVAEGQYEGGLGWGRAVWEADQNFVVRLCITTNKVSNLTILAIFAKSVCWGRSYIESSC